MLVIPAIDLKDGRCVRLRQGDMAAEVRPHPKEPFCHVGRSLRSCRSRLRCKPDAHLDREFKLSTLLAQAQVRDH